MRCGFEYERWQDLTKNWQMEAAACEWTHFKCDPSESGRCTDFLRIGLPSSQNAHTQDECLKDLCREASGSNELGFDRISP
jgi:hypothetical protein